jgi:predicted nucleic acid-binding protein
VTCKARYSILLDTNVLVRLLKDLDCEQNPCEDLITKRLLCNCNLNANIIIPKGLLNEIDFLVDDEECRNAIKVCLWSYSKEAVVGGRRVKHEISLRTDRGLANELRRRRSFIQIQEDYRKALRGVRDEVDKALISLALLIADDHKNKIQGCKTILLSMDNTLLERVHALASKAQLTDHLEIPNLSSNILGECSNADCPIKCILGDSL